MRVVCIFIAFNLLFNGASNAVRVRHTAATAAASLQPELQQPPALPASYSVNYTFTLPYTARLQQPALSYPVAFYRDAASKRVRMDSYGSTSVMIAKKGKMMEVVPRIDKLTCLVFDDDDGEGAGLAALPDVRGWSYGGTAQLREEEAEVWLYEARHEGKHVVYKFYASPTGTPLRLHMHGNDVITGSHFDEWIVDYTFFRAGPPDPALFNTPKLCAGQRAQGRHNGARSGAQLRWAALAPAVRYRGDAEYDVFLATHAASRSHASLAEYRRRRDLFQANRALIEAHNAAPGRTFSMAMNKFGDYTNEEFIALMLPKRARRQSQLSAGTSATLEGQEEGGLGGHPAKRAKHELPYQPLVNASRLPRSLTWRGTGADSVGVKDQATCGSCWTFAATGTMEGAWWRDTGRSVQFSEQQILDCSWGYEPRKPWANLACDGGDPDAAIGYVVDAGGIAENGDYPYRAQDGYCRANDTQLAGRFQGFARVPRYDDAALMEALYSRGPLAISFDASRPSFRFYSSGVYVDTECLYKPGDLDHSMVLVGYGSGEAGDYWEVKNSWSTHWGDRGYFQVARDVNRACGVASDATYAVVADGIHAT